ncbi:isocitrate lyase, partial [Hydrogenophaga laconesensis]|nr:isocitrate lyase [Hydrogenophaga laconesensis]
AALFRGYPQAVRTDNGPEFTSRAFMAWAQAHGCHEAQEVGAGHFNDVTTVIQGGSSSVKALTGSTEEEQFH